MKVVLFALAATFLYGAALRAQELQVPKFEVGFNYSGLHIDSSKNDYQVTGNGGSSAVEYNLNNLVGLVGDFERHISIKPIQVEYLMTRFDSARLPANRSFGDHQNDVRYSAGVVFKFGGE